MPDHPGLAGELAVATPFPSTCGLVRFACWKFLKPAISSSSLNSMACSLPESVVELSSLRTEGAPEGAPDVSAVGEKRSRSNFFKMTVFSCGPN